MSVKLEVKINSPKILAKTQTPAFGLFTSTEWKRLIDPYVPRDTGNLMNNIKLRPFEIEYTSPYSHYMYNGMMYADPATGAGGYFSSSYGWFSRKGVKKIETTTPLNYRTDSNPYATDHWDIKAENAGKKQILYKELTLFINR